MNGIFLLHETYDLNLTAFSLGQIEVPGQPGKIFQSKFQLNARDLVSLEKPKTGLYFYISIYGLLELSRSSSIQSRILRPRL